MQANRRWATGWQDGEALADEGLANEGLADGDVADVIEPGAGSTETPGPWADLVAEEVTVGEARTQTKLGTLSLRTAG